MTAAPVGGATAAGVPDGLARRWAAVVEAANPPPSIAAFDADKVMALINAAPGMVFACLLRADGSLAMPFASSMIETLLGLRAADVEFDAAVLAQRLHPDDRRAFERSVMVSARRLAHWRREFRYLHPDGGWRWLEARAAPQASGDGEVIWYGSVHDIAERKRFEARLQAEEARHRRRELQAANRGVEEARHAARRLAALLAGELAGPVQAMRRWAGAGTPAAAAALGAAADRLHQLRADLIEFERLTAGPLAFETMALDRAGLQRDGPATP